MGMMFDPHHHEAIAVQETHDTPPGAILGEVRRVWIMGEHVPRPSIVRAAVKPSVRTLTQDRRIPGTG